jgi:two-component system sensor histidine kinase TctE
VQSAQRGDVDGQAALREIGDTVERATTLANQMLALAKVEQIRQQPDRPAVDWADIVRAMALDLSALIVEHQLDFDIETRPAPIRAHEWALRELSRNLIHNAIKHGRDGGGLTIRLVTDNRHAALTVSDSGEGISAEQRQRLFQPFAAGGSRGGSGLGLAICHEIVDTLGGQIELTNRTVHGVVAGLDATVRLPLDPQAMAQPPAQARKSGP